MGVQTIPQPGRSGSDAAVTSLRWQKCEKPLWAVGGVLQKTAGLQNVSPREGRATRHNARHCPHCPLYALADMVRFPYQAVMKLFRALSGASVELGEDVRQRGLGFLV